VALVQNQVWKTFIQIECLANANVSASLQTCVSVCSRKSDYKPTVVFKDSLFGHIIDLHFFKWANYVGVSCIFLFCFVNWPSCPQSVWKCLLTLCCAACKCLCSSALDSSGHWTGMVDIQKSERRREIRACIKVHSYTCRSSYIFAFFNVTGLN